MRSKKFKLEKSQIAPVALGRGGCLATDRIVVDGSVIGYMYREEPADKMDSGWRFFAGDESDEYIGDNDNSGVYDVNTIVNYDPAILPFLDETAGSRFERTVHDSFRRLTRNE